ncbi:EscU/YscU/HrcU family type III secretion system export apparatus switch protein [Limnobacter humi]|uniref:EscU/YscU/HrcU family type III secretion system export apparatus switch protein n=1 Tax=Limnobacter humi TaxID=1778671 RepID=A0ABT1WDE3_9BURK|nr:EscU/YscU/HrcU family type III secretion system export apparatus switch protein [Limnobacter humi]MCQ8895547.1 EscU/YscU/HrcU family type III secretion system export apparatus switch protein [Limnobacter humi]
MSQEKTEEPTRKKLDDAREKGQVSQSKDVTVLVKLILFFGFFFGASSVVSHSALSLMENALAQVFISGDVPVEHLLRTIASDFLLMMVITVGGGAIAAIISVWVQVGILFAPEAVKPSFKKMDPISNFKNMLSWKSISQILLSLLKVIIFIVVGYYVLKDHWSEILHAPRGGLSGAYNLWLELAKKLIWPTLLVFIALVAIDWFVTHRFHMKSLRMSKHEVKEEYKQMEGNPEMKSHRKGMHKSLLDSALTRLPSAKVLVTNPTHIAVALDYEPGKHDLPYILAITEDLDAAELRREAVKLGVPIVRNVRLARAIYRDCDVDQYLKRGHLEMAAEVFRELMALRSNPQEP